MVYATLADAFHCATSDMVTAPVLLALWTSSSTHCGAPHALWTAMLGVLECDDIVRVLCLSSPHCGSPKPRAALCCPVQDRAEKESFFNFFYLSINLGSLLAVTVLVYIQDNYSWTVGFGIPAAAMAIAMLLFVAGSPRYTHVEPTERCAGLRAEHRARARAHVAAQNVRRTELRNGMICAGLRHPKGNVA